MVFCASAGVAFTESSARVQWPRFLASSNPPREAPFLPSEAPSVNYSVFLAKLLIRTGVARFLPAVQRWTDGGGAFLRYYSDQVLAAPLAPLRDLAAFQEVRGPDAMDLGLGAPRFDLVPSGSTKLPADRRGWPPAWGLPELREAVAEKLLAEQHVAFRPGDEV